MKKDFEMKLIFKIIIYRNFSYVEHMVLRGMKVIANDKNFIFISGPTVL